MAEIGFSWNGFPQFAARLIRAAIRRLDCPCVVIGSKPAVPIEGMEEALGQQVYWVDAHRPASWHDLGLDPPRIFFQSGWSYPAFSALGREVLANGGKLVVLSDANWRRDFRQLVLGALAFRLLYRRHFAAVMVPGKQGQRLMRHFGMDPRRVRPGLLGADPSLFRGGRSLIERPKVFLFVGQFIARKDVLGLAQAFLIFSKEMPGWKLRIVGSGEQKGLIPVNDSIIVEDFLQPELLVDRFKNSRFFVLPSLVEAWGLVVHEAASCGCALLLSNAIGSGDDLANYNNSIRFEPGNISSLVDALRSAAALSDAELLTAERASRDLASKFSPERFADEAMTLVSELRE